MVIAKKIKALAAIAVIAGAALAGWTMRDWQARAEEGAQASAELKAKEQMEQLANAVSAKTESAIQNIRVENRTIYQRAQREITEKPIYRDCVLPADGVRLINAARAGSAGQSDGAVPESGATPGER